MMLKRGVYEGVMMKHGIMPWTLYEWIRQCGTPDDVLAVQIFLIDEFGTEPNTTTNTTTNTNTNTDNAYDVGADIATALLQGYELFYELVPRHSSVPGELNGWMERPRILGLLGGMNVPVNGNVTDSMGSSVVIDRDDKDNFDAWCDLMDV